MPVDEKGILWDSVGEAWYNQSTGDWVHTGTPGNFGKSSSGVFGLGQGAIRGDTNRYTGAQMDIWAPEQWDYLQKLISGQLYGPGAATSYYQSVIDPRLQTQATDALRNLKGAYGPMSLGSSYKIANARLEEKLAEQRAQALAEVLWNWKQMEAAAMAKIPEMSPFASIMGYKDTGANSLAGARMITPTGGGVSSFLSNPGIGVGGGWSGSGSKGTTTTENPFIDNTPTTTNNYYYDWPTSTSYPSATPAGMSSEFANPFSGEIYNYSPGGQTYIAPTVSNYDTVANSRAAYTPEEDYNDYEWTGFW